MNPYTLKMDKPLKRQLLSYRSSVRQAIELQLNTILDDLNGRPPPRDRPRLQEGPPLRFYVWEGVRVSYQINPLPGTVVVLAFRSEPT